MNVFDVLILAGVFAAVILAVMRVRKQKKNGGCSCGCGGCAMKDTCRQKK